MFRTFFQKGGFERYHERELGYLVEVYSEPK